MENMAKEKPEEEINLSANNLTQVCSTYEFKTKISSPEKKGKS